MAKGLKDPFRSEGCPNHRNVATHCVVHRQHCGKRRTDTEAVDATSMISRSSPTNTTTRLMKASRRPATSPGSGSATRSRSSGPSTRHKKPPARSRNGEPAGAWRCRSPHSRFVPAQTVDASVESHNVQSPGRLQKWRLTRAFVWSGRRDSNPRPSPWQGDALPAEPRPRGSQRLAGRRQFRHPRRRPAVLVLVRILVAPATRIRTENGLHAVVAGCPCEPGGGGVVCAGGR